LYAIADDYEDFQTVSKTVVGWALDAGIQLNSEEICNGLLAMIRRCLINANTFSSGSFRVIEPSNTSELTAYWFSPSNQGLELLKQWGPRKES
jgi:hypothetical protein